MLITIIVRIMMMAIASAITMSKRQLSCHASKGIPKTKSNRLGSVLTYNGSLGTVNGHCKRAVEIEVPVAIIAEDLDNKDALRDRPMKH